jgi:hypothetical protein
MTGFNEILISLVAYVVDYLTMLSVSSRIRDKSVGIAMDYRLGGWGSFPGRDTIFFSTVQGSGRF